MAGLPEMKVQSVKAPLLSEEVFVPIEKSFKRRGLKVAVWGPPAVGKTHFALSAPPPIFVISTEFGVQQLAYQFAGKDIRIMEALVLTETSEKFEVKPIESFEKVEQAIAACRKITQGTIVIDSGSDIWDWIQAWLFKKHEEKVKAEKFMQFHWGDANELYRFLAMKVISRPVHVIITSREAPVYDGQGNVTGMMRPRWMKETPYFFDVVVSMQKRITGASKPVPGQIVKAQLEYVSVIEKCRYFRTEMPEIKDLTWEKLVEVLKEKLPPDVL